MANRYMEGCSASRTVKEMQIKTTVRWPLTPVGVAVIKRTEDGRCWWGCGERTLVRGLGMEVGIAIMKTRMEVPPKIKRKLPYDPAIGCFFTLLIVFLFAWLVFCSALDVVPVVCFCLCCFKIWREIWKFFFLTRRLLVELIKCTFFYVIKK